MNISRFSSLFAAVALCLAVASMPSRAALVGYWSLDGDSDADAGGWGASTVGSGGNGETDFAFVSDVPTEISGRATQSLSFDANNDDWITTAFNAQTAGVNGLPTTTLSFWMKRGAANINNNRLVFFGNAGAGGGAVMSFERSGDNVASFFFNGNRISSGNQFTTANGWIHVALTYQTNHGGSNIYIDGTLANGGNGSPGNALNMPNDATITFGAGTGGGDPGQDFNVADFSIWDEVLTAQQISDLASGTSPLVIPEPGVAALISLVGLGALFRRRR